MADRTLPHIILQGTERREPYQSPPGRGPTVSLPPRDRTKHAEHVLSRLDDAARTAEARKERRRAVGIGVSGGIYLEFESDSGHALTLQSLTDPRAGIELVAIRSDDVRRVELATVFVPEGKLSTFVKKVERYRDEDTKWAKPKNQRLVESIADVRLAVLQSFWTDDADLYPRPGTETTWEVWLRSCDGIEEVIARLDQLDGVRVASPRFDFVELSVVLVTATPESLAVAPDVLDVLAELRLAKSTAEFLDRKWDIRAVIPELLERIEGPPPDCPAVCLLDSGVDRGHPLLKRFLSAADDHLYDPRWRYGDDDGHGTEMAGVALFEDLVPILTTREPVEVEHRLESVKAIDPAAPHDPQNYGHVMAECVARAEIAAPQRNRAVCLTITAPDNRDRGRPSLWSAAIDDLCAGTADETRRLFIVSGGNIEPVEKHLGYLDRNLAEQIHDPGQAWNALTVGAYTERVVITENDFAGWQPIAAPGELSPVSSTSVAWQSRWPLKPELVLEGGNTARDPTARDATQPSSLSILTTRPTLRGILGATGDTSAAAAAAARMSAVVMARYPQLWPETVRALLVDSAEWTPAMIAQASYPKSRSEKERALRTFGYGVPSLDRACASAKNDLTLIVQGELQPFDGTGGMNDMHLHALPWPRDVLAAQEETEIELRITLSYFVEASPGRRGWGTKHRYASHGLRFDVQTATESVDEFRARVNRAAKRADIGNTSSDSGDWWIGPDLRAKGSLHHDRWTGTARDLANRGHIAIMPVLGWWRERRHLKRTTRNARYALIVRIRAPEVDADLYTAVTASIAEKVGIAGG